METPEAFLGRLKPLYIFKGLTEAEIVEVARQLEVEHFASGEVVFEEGDEGQELYIINQGQVRVLRQGRGAAPQLVATLVPGDFFGEGSLLYGRARSATVEAATALEVLRLSKEDFDALLLRFPQIKPNLLVSHESHELYRKTQFDWLAANEVVYLITRRHKVLLYQAQILPIVAGLAIAVAAVWLAVDYDAQWIAWTGAALEVPIALWLLWNSIDWSNDYYIVTNQRLVYLEKIVAIYDSRLEAPLGSIMSVNVQTDDPLQRLLHMGDIIVRTFSGPIVLKSVANPHTLAALIEEHWYRTRTREREAQMDQMKSAIRERLEAGRPVAARPPGATAPRPAAGPIRPARARFLNFQMRFERGGNVIYRKHWFMLLRKVWKPSAGILAVLVVVTLVSGGFWQLGVPLAGVVLLGVLAFIPLALWWLYEYVDWQNDIYMVTADQIFDITKKPLGSETRKSAPLGNVLSMRYERPGLLGLLLNFGTVVALVAGAEFRFEGVFDPVSVQNDVYRRIEAFNTKKAQAESLRRRDEIADWLTVYHTVQEEMEEE